MPQLTNVAKTILLKNSVVAGATDITNATVVDTQGFDGVRFTVGFGTITTGAVTSVAVSGKATNSPTPGTDDVAGSKITVPDTASNTVVILDVQHPQQRYLRPFVKRATQNAVVDFIIAELYQKTGKLPITQDATVTSTKLLDAPANGTA